MIKTNKKTQAVVKSKTVVPADGEVGANARAERKRKRSGSTVIGELIKELMIPSSAPTALVTPTPLVTPPAEVVSAPIAPAEVTAVVNTQAVVKPGLEWGKPNLNSRRINPTAVIREYRVAHNQRKDHWSAGAKYYVQGGEYRTDPESGRARFEVALEIPHIDHYQAKLQRVALQATLSAPTSTPEVA